MGYTPKDKGTILILDDNLAIVSSLSDFLEDQGFGVFSFSSAEEALCVIEMEAFNVGIIDLRLSGINGEDFIVKAHAIRPLAKFVLQTGNVNYELSKKMIECGLSKEDVFLKPVQSLNMLLNKINELLTS